MKYSFYKLLFIICVLFSSYVAAKPQDYLNIQLVDEESYTESFTLITLLSDQSYLLTQAMLTNGGFGDENPACRILYVDSLKKSINEAERSGSWSYSAKKKYLKIGSCSIQETKGGLKWKAKTDQLELALDLTGKKRKVSTQAMKVKVSKNGHFYHNELLLTSAKIKGWLKKKGKKINVKGIGSLNHTRSTTLPPELATGWFKLYAFPLEQSSSNDASKTLLLSLKAIPQSGKKVGWYFRESQKEPLSLTHTQLGDLRTFLKKRLRVKQTLTLSDTRQPPSNYEVTKLKELFVYEPVRAYGLVGKVLKKWIGDPINYTSYIELKGPQGMMHGIIEEVRFR